MPEEIKQNNCANCEKIYQIDYEFCPHCGQKNESSVLTFKEIFSDLLGSFFSFDSKAINSLPKLLFRPGQLTVDYLKGKRVSNLSPFKMYLFFSVVLFLLLPMVLEDDNVFSNNTKESNKTEQALLDSIEVEDNRNSIVNFGFDDSLSISKWSEVNELIDNGYTTNEAIDSMFADNGRLMKFAMQQAFKINDKEGSGLIGVFLNSLSYSLFLFLPLFALFLKLFYLRRKRFYIEHVIFSLHIFSFIFVVLILFTLFDIFKLSIPIWISFAVVMPYLYFAMLKVYQQKWRKTIFKSIALFFTTTIFLVPLMLILVTLVSFLFY